MDAFVMKFNMEVDGKIIEGKVEKIRKAEKLFDNVSKMNVVANTLFYL